MASLQEQVAWSMSNLIIKPQVFTMVAKVSIGLVMEVVSLTKEELVVLLELSLLKSFFGSQNCFQVSH